MESLFHAIPTRMIDYIIKNLLLDSTLCGSLEFRVVGPRFRGVSGAD